MRMAEYVVKAGNYLNKIAAMFGVTTGDLVEWNESKYPSLANDPNLIQPGWTLQVSKPATTTPAEPSPVTGRSYVVSDGDNITLIANKFGITPEELIKANLSRYPSLAKDPNLIQPGWVLSIPYEDVPDPVLPPLPNLPTYCPPKVRPTAYATNGVGVGLMYDSVRAASIPRNAQYVAGYVDGANTSYIWTESDWSYFPNAVKLGITVTGKTDGASIIDVEHGDATIQTAVDWVSRNNGGIIYLNLSTYTGNQAALAPIKDKAAFWIADWTNAPHLIDVAVATQYQSTNDYDLSLIRTDLIR